MTRRTLVTWTVLILVPIVPVLVLYLIFDEQNYFELENAARGIVATGPIAAYIAVVWIGSRLNKQISSQVHPLTEAEEKLVGTRWSFKAHSAHDSDREGTFRISTDERSRLHLEGNFKMKGGGDVGSWSSTMAKCESEQLQIVYCLSDSGKGELRNSTGLLTLNPDQADADKMSGSWTVLGSATSMGSMTCQRIKS